VTVRLDILDHGHPLGTRLLFGFIRLVSRQPTPEVMKILRYRPDFFGGRLRPLTHEAMRGPSEWSVADRELMAAYVSKLNGSAFCIRAHTAVTAELTGDEAKVARVLEDPEAADLAAPLRETLLLLGKLVRSHVIDADDVRHALNAGATPSQIEDALAVCFAFDVINRLSDAFEFDVPSPAAFQAGAKYLVARGYR
jgi:AhpD family alkylhydroperoxidase